MDANLSELLAEVKAVAALKGAFTDLLEVAFIDVTTLILNRRAFDEFAATSPSSSYAAIFVDLTAFKSINERHGHDVGDFALAHVGDHLGRVCRSPDALPFRYGGDEFVILVAKRKIAALSAKNAARLRWRKLTVKRGRSAPLAIPFSAALGLARPDPAISVRDLVGRAERAAKASKSLGDRLVVWSKKHDDQEPTEDVRRRCTACEAISSVILAKRLITPTLLSKCPACGGSTHVPP